MADAEARKILSSVPWASNGDRADPEDVGHRPGGGVDGCL